MCIYVYKPIVRKCMVVYMYACLRTYIHIHIHIHKHTHTCVVSVKESFCFGSLGASYPGAAPKFNHGLLRYPLLHHAHPKISPNKDLIKAYLDFFVGQGAA